MISDAIEYLGGDVGKIQNFAICDASGTAVLLLSLPSLRLTGTPFALGPGA